MTDFDKLSEYEKHMIEATAMGCALGVSIGAIAVYLIKKEE